jgi:hypothetical protein
VDSELGAGYKHIEVADFTMLWQFEFTGLEFKRGTFGIEDADFIFLGKIGGHYSSIR